MISQEELSMMLRDQERRKEEQNDNILSTNFLTSSGRKKMSKEGKILLRLMFIIRKEKHLQKNTMILDGCSRHDQKENEPGRKALSCVLPHQILYRSIDN